MQETQVRSLILEDPICHGTTEPVFDNYWACALKPGSCNYWACVPYSLCSTREDPAMRSPSATSGEWPPLLLAREKPTQHNQKSINQ